MKNKVILIISLILLLGIGLFALTGCGKKEEKGTETKEDVKSSQSSEAAEKTEETTTSKTKSNVNYEYKEGVLTQILDEDGKPKQTDFVIDGIILVGNRHNYRGENDEVTGAESMIEELSNNKFKKEGINSNFYLNEYIEFYIDTKYAGATDDVKILVVPHKTMEEFESMSLSELEELANQKGGFVLDYKTPEEDNYKYVGEGYVNMDYPEGEYDILFTYKGNIAYFINITEVNEPTN